MKLLIKKISFFLSSVKNVSFFNTNAKIQQRWQTNLFIYQKLYFFQTNVKKYDTNTKINNTKRKKKSKKLPLGSDNVYYTFMLLGFLNPNPKFI